MKSNLRKKTCIQGASHRVEPYSLVVQDSLSGYAPMSTSAIFVALNISSSINRDSRVIFLQN
jgi:hypothetical protein